MRDFVIAVRHGSKVSWEGVCELVSGIFEIELDGQFEVLFVPFEPQMAPPFPTGTAHWHEFDEWETPADARLGRFFVADLVVTPYDPLAGQEMLFPSWEPGTRGVGGHGERWKATSGVVFYTSTEQFQILAADLERLSETHSDRSVGERALGLRGRPVVNFLVERLQTSRLVPDELLHRLGLERSSSGPI